MNGIGWAILAFLLLGNRQKVTRTNAAQGGPGANQNNLVTALLNAFSRNQSGARAQTKAPGGGPGSSGGGFSSGGGRQSAGNRGQQCACGTCLEGADGLSGFLNAFPPGTTLGDAIQQGGQDCFREGLSCITGIDVGHPEVSTCNVPSCVQLDPVNTCNVNGEAIPSSGNPFDLSSGAGVCAVTPDGQSCGCGCSYACTCSGCL